MCSWQQRLARLGLQPNAVRMAPSCRWGATASCDIRRGGTRACALLRLSWRLERGNVEGAHLAPIDGGDIPQPPERLQDGSPRDGEGEDPPGGDGLRRGLCDRLHQPRLYRRLVSTHLHRHVAGGAERHLITPCPCCHAVPHGQPGQGQARWCALVRAAAELGHKGTEAPGAAAHGTARSHLHRWDDCLWIILVPECFEWRRRGAVNWGARDGHKSANRRPAGAARRYNMGLVPERPLARFLAGTKQLESARKFIFPAAGRPAVPHKIRAHRREARG